MVIGDGFIDKTLKLQYLKLGGHMGCLYYEAPAVAVVEDGEA